MILVPLWAAYIIEWKSPISQNIKKAAQPKDNWGPKSVALRNEWEKFKADRRETRESLNKISGSGKLRQFMSTVFGC